MCLSQKLLETARESWSMKMLYGWDGWRAAVAVAWGYWPVVVLPSRSVECFGVALGCRIVRISLCMNAQGRFDPISGHCLPDGQNTSEPAAAIPGCILLQPTTPEVHHNSSLMGNHVDKRPYAIPCKTFPNNSTLEKTNSKFTQQTSHGRKTDGTMHCQT